MKTGLAAVAVCETAGFLRKVQRAESIGHGVMRGEEAPLIKGLTMSAFSPRLTLPGLRG